MRVINTSVNTLSTRYLVIGFEGENERTQIRIDAASVFAEYPQASPSIVVKPGFGEEVYPVIVTKEGNEVVWDVTQDNLDFTGDGEIQLTFIKDNVICKTTIGKIRVNRSLIVNGDPPEHLDTWYEGATTKLADVDEAVNALEAIDAIAHGLPAGSDPTVTLRYVEVLGHKRFTFEIPKGDKGDKGDRGNGIRSISQSGSTGLYKKYTIHFTDGTTTTFQVRDGDRGLKGDTGATPDIGIGTVETLPAGSGATASMSGTVEEPLLNLGIPKGDTGEKGDKGDKGDRGATPVFSMGAVTNLPAGTSATATITGTAEEPVLNLGIPKGDKGDKGDRGERGPQGIQGVQGDRGLTGPRGEQGQKGDKGDTGATGATGATPDFSIGTVSTLPAGSSATAEITGTAENPVLSLGIPQGEQGEKGEKGEKGDPGDGVPVGGLKGQVLAKANDTDRDTKWMYVAPVVKNTASGAIASFPDGADGHPVDELKVQIEPVQDLHGYDHPWPAGGGKNLLAPFSNFSANGLTTTANADGSITVSGTATSDGTYITADSPLSKVIPAGTSFVFNLTNSPPVTVRALLRPSGASDIGQNETYRVQTRENDITAVALYLRTVSGTTYNFTIYPMIELGTTGTAFEPYENICPITGWDGVKVTRTGKNLFDKTTAVTGERFNDSGTQSQIGTTRSAYIHVKPNTTYYFKNVRGISQMTPIWWYDKDKNFISRINIGVPDPSSGTATSPANAVYLGINIPNAYIDSACVNYPSTDTDYRAYQGTTYDITLPSEAGTVYGGELTVNADGSGSLVVDRAMVDLGTLSFGVTDVNRFYNSTPIPDFVRATSTDERATGILCSIYKPSSNLSYSSSQDDCSWLRGSTTSVFDFCIKDERYTSTSDFRTAMSGVQLVYELATPLTYALTPTEIRTLLGQNNVWADTGDVSVKYNADTKLYIDNKITQAIAAALNS